MKKIKQNGIIAKILDIFNSDNIDPFPTFLIIQAQALKRFIMAKNRNTRCNN